jgi:hypothetical protein
MIRSRSILCITLLAALPAIAPAAAASLALGGQPVRVGDVLFVSPAVQLEPQTPAITSDCPVERTIPLVDGAEAAAWPAAWPAGDHTAAVAAVDRCGKRAESAPLAFRVDAAAPTVRWEAADTELFESYGEPLAKRRSEGDRWDRRREREREREREQERQRERERGRRAEDTLAWSADGRGWIAVGEPLPGQTAEQAGELRIESSRPQIFLRGPGTLATAGGPVDLAEGKVLRVFAEDADSGVARLSIKLRRAAAGAAGGVGKDVLDVEAVDLVGNPQRLEWAVTRR